MNISTLNKSLLLFVLLTACGLLGLYLFIMLRNQVHTQKVVTSGVITKKINKSFNVPHPPYNLTISGSVSSNGKVSLNPFFFIHSYYQRQNTRTLSRGLDKSEITSTQFEIVLKRKGVVILRDQLYVGACLKEGLSGFCTKSTSNFGSFKFSTYGLEVLPDSISILNKGHEIYQIMDPQTAFPTVILTSEKIFRDGFGIGWSTSSNLKFLVLISNQNLETSQNVPEEKIIESEVSGSDTFVWNRSSSISQDFNGNIWIALYATDGFHTVVGFSDKFSSPND